MENNTFNKVYMSADDRIKVESMIRNRVGRGFTGVGMFYGHRCKFRDGKMVSALPGKTVTFYEVNYIDIRIIDKPVRFNTIGA